MAENFSYIVFQGWQKFSGTINGILQCGLGRSKALQWGKKTFWVKCGLNADPFQSFCGLMSHYSHQNSKRSLKSAYLRNYTFRDKSLCVQLFIMVELMYIIPGDACSRFTPSCLLFPRAAAYLLPSIVQFRLQSITMEKMRPNCGPVHQLRSHADQGHNCGLLWKHCTSSPQKL